MDAPRVRLRVCIVSALSLWCAAGWTLGEREAEERRHEETRKLFGGYRITPRHCQPARGLAQEAAGPSICMFNHECGQRNGAVVGACMDGFLFGACCQLPAGGAGEELAEDVAQTPSSGAPHYTASPELVGHITSSGMSKIAQTLLYGGGGGGGSGVLPTAADNAVVQINEQDHFVTAGVTHPTAPDTVVVTAGSNDISADQFGGPSAAEDRQTTHGLELTTRPYVHISISNAPSYYTPAPLVGEPAFRPKPKPKPSEAYVLVPTIAHKTRNKTDATETLVSIVQMVNDTRKPATPPSVVYVATATTSARPASIPTTAPRRTTTKIKLTTKKRLGGTTKKTTGTKKDPSSVAYGTKATATTPALTTSTTAATSTSATHQTFRPSSGYTTKKPPSTSYVYSSTISQRPGATVAVPGYAVTRPPSAPTIIVLGPTSASTTPDALSHQHAPTKYTTLRPSTYTTLAATKHPVAVTINNHITQHIHNTSQRPAPTVLITPKPSAATTPALTSYYADETHTTDGDSLVNFPPVRNPNLNMSLPLLEQQDADVATPAFIEDAALDTKVESFVNTIIAGLQGPFEGLKDIVYAGVNQTGASTTRKPAKKTPTRKPTKGTTRAPAALTTTTTTERVKTTTKKVRTTKPTEKKKATTVPTTTTESYIEHDDVSQDYRAQCGIRPLVKAGRIVGGKGAAFGEFPWQVLVRESTWLGLFTKNKCGGVLISSKFVMTAAHCQPGFLASLVAVFGEFDISGDLEAKRAISRNVKRVIVHRQYDAATFENDLALLELEQPIQFDAHIVPICLPRSHEDFTGRMATVTGWGRLKYGGGVPSVLQEVQVPIMENAVCQEMFRTAGHQKVILESFLCAGYANGQKDSCEGDSGGPLVLQRPDGRYQLAGTVSHGIKCAAPYLPGVYMRTTFYKPWIESVTSVH